MVGCSMVLFSCRRLSQNGPPDDPFDCNTGVLQPSLTATFRLLAVAKSVGTPTMLAIVFCIVSEYDEHHRRQNADIRVNPMTMRTQVDVGHTE